jgi:hypothetical protein
MPGSSCVDVAQDQPLRSAATRFFRIRTPTVVKEALMTTIAGGHVIPDSTATYQSMTTRDDTKNPALSFPSGSVRYPWQT